MDDSTQPATKRCCTCKATKPLDQFGKDRQSPDGLKRRCRGCKAAEKRKYRLKYPEKVAAQNRKWRLENPEKSRRITERYREAHREEINERLRLWRAENSERYLEQLRRWRQKNPEKVAAYRQRRQETQPEAVRAEQRRYYEKNAQKKIQKVLAWRQANPGRHTETVRRRAARKRSATVGPIDLDALWTQHDGTCALCGAPMDRDLAWPDPMSKSIDHIVPLAKGGTHEQSNIQWTHLVCNQRKGTQVP